MPSEYTVNIAGVAHGFSYTGDTERIRYDWDGPEVPECPHCADWLAEPGQRKAWVMNGDRIGDLRVYCPSCAEEVGKAKEHRR